MALDFCGLRPHGRMISRTSSTGTWRMCLGLSARAKRAGVIWLTLASVHCALSSTATSSV